jgi:hypothetical protein
MGPEIGYYIGLTMAEKTVLKDEATGCWARHADGQVMCVFQVAEADEAGNVYHARSFEDAFFHINRPFMRDATTSGDETKKPAFPSLTNVHLRTYLNDNGSSFAMAENGIGKKPSFAIEILLNSETKSEMISNAAGNKKDFAFEFSNWKTPKYIEEGLAWIKQG